MKINRYVISFILACSTILIVGVRGIEYGRLNNFSDQSIQIPVIRSYTEPTLFPDDILLSARSQYVTFFYPLLGLLANVIPLASLLIGLYLIMTVIATTAIYALADTLFPGTGIVAAILFMAYFPNPGGDFTHVPFVTHTTFAFALQIIALILIFRARSIAAAILLGITANLNPMSTFFVVFAWIVAMLLDQAQWSHRLIVIPLIIGVLALPVLIWRFGSTPSTIAPEVYLAINRVRSPYHLFPFSISPALWITFFALILIWRFSFRYGTPPVHRQILSMSAGIALLVVVGTVFSEFVPVVGIIQLSLVRATWLINVFILVYLSHLMIELLQRRGWNALLTYVLIVLFAGPRLLIELAPQPQPVPYPLFIDLETGFVRDNLLIILALLVIAVTIIVRVLPFLIESHNAAGITRWSVFAVVCFTLPLLISNGVPTSQRETTAEWSEMLNWIRDNTLEDARFFTPPTIDGFRVGAERAHLGDWKDGTLGIFDGDFVQRWWDIMLESGFEAESRTFHALSATDICTILTHYDLDYALVYQEWGIDMPAIQENEVFSLISAEGLKC